MKKIFVLLFIPVLILFNSCLGNNDSTPSGVEEGTILYSLANYQLGMDMDPIILALKLQALITTAADEGQPYSTVKVTIPSEDKDGKDEEIIVIEALFGKENTVTKNGNEWTLDYSGARLDKERYNRIGEITIDTHGFDLHELADDPSYKWDIVIPDNGYRMGFIQAGEFVNRISSCSIHAGPEPNTWVLTGHSTSYFQGSPELSANWDLEYNLTFPGEASFSYLDILNSTFYLDAEIEGIPAGANIKVKYTAVDLKYKPRCYLWFIYGGTEYVEVFDRAKFPVDTYPELKVKYMWIDNSGTTPCSNAVEISYNGYTVTT